MTSKPMLLMICQSCVISAILIKSYSMPYGSPAVRINYYLLFHIQRMSKVPQFIHYFGAQSNESSQFCLAPPTYSFVAQFVVALIRYLGAKPIVFKLCFWKREMSTCHAVPSTNCRVLHIFIIKCRVVTQLDS